MTTFISYSRVNSAFVVRLAKDLKSAGFDVWLDQIDIPKGARWDDEIEAAVERSSTFMIVLAPESIESQNVKDELSYAIDSGKQILPVIIRPCKIPLRLRRFQYVDFTDKPYKDSLADIKHLLSNTQRIVKAPEEPVYMEPEQEDPTPLVKGPLLHHRREAAPLETVRSENRNPIYKFIIPGVLAAVSIAALAIAVGNAMKKGDQNIALPPTVETITITAIPPTTVPTITPTPLPAQFVDAHGVPMRLVSAGDFTMGSEGGPSDEGPVQTLYVDTFYIDRYEVTNGLYRLCVNAGACKPPKRVNSVTRVGYYNRTDFDNYPVVQVDWNMAKSFCEWRGARLPTEAEWEKAARGTDGRTYPWGEGISCDQANFGGCQGDTIAASGDESGASVYGVFNMAGNVYEWVSSLYMPYPYEASDGRENLSAFGERVIRGGSWVRSDTDEEARSAHRQKVDPSTAQDNIGFRCAFTPVTSADLINITPENGSTATAIVATNRSHRTKVAQTQTLALTSTLPFVATNTPAVTVDLLNLTPGLTATATEPVATATDQPSELTATPTDRPTSLLTSTPTDEPAPTPTDEPAPTPTDEPAPTPTDEPAPTPTDEPRPTPTDRPPDPTATDPPVVPGG